MSSMQSKNRKHYAALLPFGLSLSLLAAPAAVAETPTDAWPASRITAPASLRDGTEGNIPAALQRWKMLRASPNYAFTEYASFLMTYPGWPGEDDLRKSAETSLAGSGGSAEQITAFFAQYPPLTGAGMARYAFALGQIGDHGRAADMAKKAWTSGPISEGDEAALLNGFGTVLTDADHDARMDALISAGATIAGTRQLPRTSAERRAAFAAALAMRQRSADAPALAAQVGDSAQRDAAYVAERARYLTKSGQLWGARELLANRPPLATRPSDPEKWYEILLSTARGAANDGQYDTAYRIASKIDDALPPGYDLPRAKLGVRDDYTSLAWLGGRTALEQLGRPADAIGLFERYARAARSPQTVSKGFYWAARAARQAGDARETQRLLEEAARYADHFYGMLAMEELGRPLPRPATDWNAIDGDGRADANPLFMAASIADDYGSWQDQSLFVRAIGNKANSEQQVRDAVALSRTLARPDLAVIAGRNARIEGISSVIGYGFPVVHVPAEHERNYTIIHAVSRQESQFDRAAISHAGARGLMQLMPGTARELSGKIGVGYAPSALTTDTDYNIRLGSTYINMMLNYFNGSYPMAIAAYNAGPGNVNKFLRANGDPRNPGIDIVRWIEDIPLQETRNYVQRVLENAVMYDLLYPEHARIRSDRPLSTYLGR